MTDLDYNSIFESIFKVKDPYRHWKDVIYANNPICLEWHLAICANNPYPFPPAKALNPDANSLSEWIKGYDDGNLS